MSPYFEPTELDPPYYCPNCQAWFQPSHVTCCVYHGPGTCCHIYEIRLHPDWKPAEDAAAALMQRVVEP